MNLRNEFILWYFNEFRVDPLYRVMSSVVESSPWHRESDVGTHTDMVVAQYLSRSGHPTWTDEDSRHSGRVHLLGGFAAAFHDVAKPHAMQIKHSEARGEYKAFNGHEKLSARLFEDWALKHWDVLRNRFKIIPEELYSIGWMVENHLPWGLKKRDKLEMLAMTLVRKNLVEVFANLLMADTTGRISDDAAEKYAKSSHWIDSVLMPVCETVRQEYASMLNGLDGPRMIMPIAASGTGKSTLFTKVYQDDGFAHFSLDEERMWFASQELDFFGVGKKNVYSLSWAYCNDHKSEFNAYWQAKFVRMVKSGADIYVDGTNLSRKSRRFFTDLAKRHGYWRVAVLIPTTLQTCTNRQSTRLDKDVPYKGVQQQYDALQLPWYGEFEEVLTAVHNIEGNGEQVF